MSTSTSPANLTSWSRMAVKTFESASEGPLARGGGLDTIGLGAVEGPGPTIGARAFDEASADGVLPDKDFDVGAESGPGDNDL